MKWILQGAIQAQRRIKLTVTEGLFQDHFSESANITRTKMDWKNIENVHMPSLRYVMLMLNSSIAS